MNPHRPQPTHQYTTHLPGAPPPITVRAANLAAARELIRATLTQPGAQTPGATVKRHR